MKLLRITVTCALAMLVAVPVARAQQNDEAYTAKILEYTTEPFFMTPHVDHLPASETVPTPLDVLGHIAGAPDVLSYPAEVYRYMRALAEASPRSRDDRYLSVVPQLIAHSPAPVVGETASSID